MFSYDLDIALDGQTCLDITKMYLHTEKEVPMCQGFKS